MKKKQSAKGNKILFFWQCFWIFVTMLIIKIYTNQNNRQSNEIANLKQILKEKNTIIQNLQQNQNNVEIDESQMDSLLNKLNMANKSMENIINSI